MTSETPTEQAIEAALRHVASGDFTDADHAICQLAEECERLRAAERKTELDKEALEKAAEAFYKLDSQPSDPDFSRLDPRIQHAVRHRVESAIDAYLTALPQSAGRLVNPLLDWAAFLATDEGAGCPPRSADAAAALLREAAASLSQVPEGWRTMDSAPKDGTPVWLWDGLGVTLAAYDTVDYDEGDGPTDCWIARSIISGDEEYIEAPTLWRPQDRPAAPSLVKVTE